MERTAMALGRQTLNFYRLYNEKVARQFRALHTNELSQVEYLLMAIVVSDGESPVKSLCERTMMLKQQVTKTLKHLEELGYVTRERDSQNRRAVIVHPTAKAQALQERVQRDVEADLSRIFAQLDPEAASDYLASLESINSILALFPSGRG